MVLCFECHFVGKNIPIKGTACETSVVGWILCFVLQTFAEEARETNASHISFIEKRVTHMLLY